MISILNLAKLDSNHCNGIVYVEDIGCNDQLTVATGRLGRFEQCLNS